LTRLLDEAVVKSMWVEPSAQETPEPR
jgi:hypothetical protein